MATNSAAGPTLVKVMWDDMLRNRSARNRPRKSQEGGGRANPTRIPCAPADRGIAAVAVALAAVGIWPRGWVDRRDTGYFSPLFAPERPVGLPVTRDAVRRSPFGYEFFTAPASVWLFRESILAGEHPALRRTTDGRRGVSSVAARGSRIRPTRQDLRRAARAPPLGRRRPPGPTRSPSPARRPLVADLRRPPVWNAAARQYEQHDAMAESHTSRARRRAAAAPRRSRGESRCRAMNYAVRHRHPERDGAASPLVQTGACRRTTRTGALSTALRRSAAPRQSSGPR